jgi:hypothetical protein
MKLSIRIFIVSTFLSAPLAAFAQNNALITRAQVQDELVQLRNAGYTGSGSDTTYPTELHAALARISAQQQATSHDTSYGMESGGSSQAGESKTDDNVKPIYFGQ